jgi:hypothetical protein
MSAIFKLATSKILSPISPPFLVNSYSESLERRCGRAFNNTYKIDRNYLFLDVLCRPRTGKGRAISSFFVRASIYFAFFGDYSRSRACPSIQNPVANRQGPTEAATYSPTHDTPRLQETLIVPLPASAEDNLMQVS